MTGIAGCLNARPKRIDVLLENMSKSLSYTERVLVDTWSNDLIGVCRVHHGVTNRKPQPIFNSDKSVFIMMDGEIFDKGDISDTAASDDRSVISDAEYCLDAYENLKDQCFNRLNGSFSIVIYNSASEELLLVTDRFSSRPLFYSVTNGSIFFGSKIAPLLQSPEVSRELDIHSIFEFLTFQMIFGTKTLYNGIHLVPPGTVLHYQHGTISLNQYWKLRYKEIKRPQSFYVNRLSKLLTNAVEKRTRDTNYRYGILLSGGLDSRTVLAATTRQITAFTVGESQNREVRTAEAIARTKGCKFVFVKRETDHYVKNLEKAIDLSDGLYMFIHAHFINLLEQISNECDIIIHGCYLDNFKGFGFPPQRTVKNLGKEIGHKRLGMRPSFHADHHLAKLSEEKLAQAILEDTRFANQTLLHSPRRIFTPLYSEQVTVHMNQAIRNLVKEAYERGANLSDVWDYIITWHVLSKQRTYLHLSHIRAFMPERTMIFDNDLFDLYLEMPAEFKRDGKVYRKALKKLNPKIAVIPDANTGFNPQISKKLYPILSFLIAKKRILVSKKKQELLTNQSQGSWPDITEMLRQDSNLKILLEEAIKNPRCLDPTIFDIESIIQLLRDHTERRADHTMLLYLLLTFGRWHRKFGPKAAAYDQDSKKLTRYDEDENWNEKISKLQNDINRLTQELDGLQQEVKKRDLIITQLHNSLNNSLSLRLARRIPFGARIRKLLVPE